MYNSYINNDNYRYYYILFYIIMSILGTKKMDVIVISGAPPIVARVGHYKAPGGVFTHITRIIAYYSSQVR